MIQGTDSSYHHALCVTDDQPAVAAALAMVLGVAPESCDFAWAAGSRALISTLLGADSAGTIEISPLPDELRGRLIPGTTSISFAVDDLAARVAACRAADLDVTVAPHRPTGASDLSYAVVTVGGVEFELVQLERS